MIHKYIYTETKGQKSWNSINSSNSEQNSLCFDIFSSNGYFFQHPSIIIQSVVSIENKNSLILFLEKETIKLFSYQEDPTNPKNLEVSFEDLYKSSLYKKVWKNKNVFSSLSEHVKYLVYLETSNVLSEIIIFNLKDLSKKRILTYNQTMNSICLTTDYKYLIMNSGGSKVSIWNISKNFNERSLVGHTEWVNSLALSSNQKYVISGSNDKTVRLWEFLTGKCKMCFIGHSEKVVLVGFTKNDKFGISASCDFSIRIWNLVTFNIAALFCTKPTFILCFDVFENSENIVAGGMDGKIFRWSLKTYENQITVEHHFGPVIEIKLFCKDKFFICFSKEAIKIWSSFDNLCVFLFENQKSLFSCFKFNEFLNIGILGTIQGEIGIFDLKNLCRSKFLNHDDKITDILLSKNNEYILTGSNDKTIGIFDLEFKKLVFKIQAHSPIVSLKLSENNKWLTSVTQNSEFFVINFQDAISQDLNKNDWFFNKQNKFSRKFRVFILLKGKVRIK